MTRNEPGWHYFLLSALWLGLLIFSRWPTNILIDSMSFVLALFLLTVLVYALRRLSGGHNSFWQVGSVVSLGIGFFVLDILARPKFNTFIDSILPVRHYFLYGEIFSIFCGLAFSLAFLYLVTFLLEKESKNIIRRNKRFLILGLCVLLLFEFAVLAHQIRFIDQTRPLSLSGVLQDEPLFFTEDVLDRCSLNYCARITDCYAIDKNYACRFTVDVLFDGVVANRFGKIRNGSLDRNQSIGTLVVFGGDEEISRVLLNFSEINDLPTIVQIGGVGFGATESLAQKNASNRLLAIIGS